MRGKVEFDFTAIFQARITPAHAGKSIKHIVAAIKCEDHPRPCGEKSPDYYDKFVEKGSPPPMRGKVRLFSCFILLCGITPAHAGKRIARMRLLDRA